MRSYVVSTWSEEHCLYLELLLWCEARRPFSSRSHKAGGRAQSNGAKNKCADISYECYVC